MLDHGNKWAEIPQWATANIDTPSVKVRSVPGLTQHLVSGNIDGFRQTHGLAPPIGGLGLAAGWRYAAWMARDRVLAVGIEELVQGWNFEGYAVTRMSSAMHVFEIFGERAIDLVTRACVVDSYTPGPSAATSFAGVVSCLYRHEVTAAIRVHVDRSLAPYLWSWITSQRLLRDAA
jgi:hypothetical protein